MNTLVDTKTASVYKIRDALEHGCQEWEAQMNIQAALCRKNGIAIDRLQIFAIARDWRRGESYRDPAYPRQAQTIDIPLWTDDEQDAYIIERVRLHRMNPPRECTDEERWYTGDSWAVMKPGGKRAVRVFETEDEAIEFAEGQAYDTHIEHRPGQYNRCNGYCNAADFCEQWQRDREDV